MPGHSPEPTISPAKPIVELTGHTEGILALAFSPDRGLLASSSMDGTCRVWAIGSNSSTQRSLIQQQGDRFRSLTFAPNSRTLAAGSGSPNGLVWLYDVTERSPKEVSTLKGAHGAVLAVAVSPDGQLVAAGGEDRAVRVWQPGLSSRVESRTVLSGHGGVITAIAFTPDSQGVATAARDGSVRLWALGKIRTTERAALPHEGDVSTLTYSPDGKLFATATDGKVRLWDLSPVRPTVRLEMKGVVEPFRVLRFTEDSRHLVGVGTGTVVINWDTRTGRPEKIWDVPSAGGSAVAMTRDGRYLGIGSLNGNVDVYRVADKRT